jgi:phosphoribosylaminoimidazolecarboxamide formyltransferase/IMP cyclohydrolase
MLDGRVKTLHPKVHAGILARRDLPAHTASLRDHAIPTIDLVVVNLYPFRETVAKTDARSRTPSRTSTSAVRRWCARRRRTGRTSASSSTPTITRPCSPSSLKDARCRTPPRFRLMRKAFAHTASYDGAIANWLTARDAEGEAQRWPDVFNFAAVKVQDMRYGENPHQSAAFYRDEQPARGTIATYRQLQGKELSYNNVADSDAAWECVKTFAEPACVIVKHANPCGVAVASTPLDAYRKAFATDPTSAFGGIIAFNRPVDAATVDAVAAQFLEVLIAPSYTDDALVAIAKKVNVRVLEIPTQGEAQPNAFDIKRVGGGVLVQSPD